MSFFTRVKNSLIDFDDAIFSANGFHELWYRSLKKTRNRLWIRYSVYNEKRYYTQYVVSQNKRLTEKQCRYLYASYSRLGDDIAIGYLLNQPNFPSDLLSSIALTESWKLALDLVANHPNTTKETKVIIALRRGATK